MNRLPITLTCLISLLFCSVIRIRAAESEVVSNFTSEGPHMMANNRQSGESTPPGGRTSRRTVYMMTREGKNEDGNHTYKFTDALSLEEFNVSMEFSMEHYPAYVIRRNQLFTHEYRLHMISVFDLSNGTLTQSIPLRWVRGFTLFDEDVFVYSYKGDVFLIESHDDQLKLKWVAKSPISIERMFIVRRTSNELTFAIQGPFISGGFLISKKQNETETSTRLNMEVLVGTHDEHIFSFTPRNSSKRESDLADTHDGRIVHRFPVNERIRGFVLHDGMFFYKLEMPEKIWTVEILDTSTGSVRSIPNKRVDAFVPAVV